MSAHECQDCGGTFHTYQDLEAHACNLAARIAELRAEVERLRALQPVISDLQDDVDRLQAELDEARAELSALTDLIGVEREQRDRAVRAEARLVEAEEVVRLQQQRLKAALPCAPDDLLTVRAAAFLGKCVR